MIRRSRDPPTLSKIDTHQTGKRGMTYGFSNSDCDVIMLRDKHHPPVDNRNIAVLVETILIPHLHNLCSSLGCLSEACTKESASSRNFIDFPGSWAKTIMRHRSHTGQLSAFLARPHLLCKWEQRLCQDVYLALSRL